MAGTGNTVERQNGTNLTTLPAGAFFIQLLYCRAVCVLVNLIVDFL